MKAAKSRKASSSTLPDSVKGFTLLPVKLSSSLPSVQPALHVLYLRRHEEQAPSNDSSRTIFLVNIPIDATKEIIRALFDSLGGRPEDISFHGEDNDNSEHENFTLPQIWDRSLHSSGSTAHVRFPTSTDIDKIFKMISKERRNQGGAIREWGVGVDKTKSSLGLQSDIDCAISY